MVDPDSTRAKTRWVKLHSVSAPVSGGAHLGGSWGWFLGTFCISMSGLATIETQCESNQYAWVPVLLGSAGLG